MSQLAVQEIFQNPDNQFLLGQDNLFNYKYSKQQAGNLMINVRDSLYTNVRLDYITFSQTDDKKSVLNGGKLITFNIKNQPFGAIETLKYHFSFTNYTANPYVINSIYNIINYIEIFNNNRSVEKIDANVQFLQNLISVRQDTYILQNSQKGINSITIAANGNAEFMIEIPCFLTKNCINFNSLGDVSINIKFNADITTSNIDSVQLSLSEIFVYYYELTPSQDAYMRGLKSIEYRYLQVDHATYYIDNVLANNSFKFKLTQDCVTPFIIFHIQTKSDNDSFTNRFANFLPATAYELLGRNNQSTMNNVINTQFFNNYQLLKHFQDRYHLTNSTSQYFNYIYMLNFCINSILALQGNYVGGQAIEDNMYELKLTLPTAQTSIAVNVYLFNYQMSHVANKQVVFLDQ